MALGWRGASQLDRTSWECGYCNRSVGGNVGFAREHDRTDKAVYICPYCENPSAFIVEEDGLMHQYPAPVRGHEVEGLPASVGALYSEIRRCVQYTAYTSAVLSMRKLLMHVAVDKGAEEGRPFLYYIDYLDAEHWIPPSGRDWVDAIRKGGNEAAHEIAVADAGKAGRLLDFVEMLLRIVYEFPGKIER